MQQQQEGSSYTRPVSVPTLADICPLACHVADGGKSCFECYDCTAPTYESCDIGYDLDRGCDHCDDGIDNTCGACAPAGRSTRSECGADTHYHDWWYSDEEAWERASRKLSDNAEIRQLIIPIGAALGTAIGVILVGVVTDFASDTAAARAGEESHGCAHCWTMTSGAAREIMFSALLSATVWTANISTEIGLRLGPAVYSWDGTERLLLALDLDVSGSYYLARYIVETALIFMVLRLASTRSNLLSHLGAEDLTSAIGSTDDEDSIGTDLTGHVVTPGNAVAMDGMDRDCVEAMALAPHSMLQGRKCNSFNSHRPSVSTHY
jgi:hypothetical protein